MLVPDGQQFAFAIFDPKLAFKAATLWTMAVAAGVITGFTDATVGTNGDVAAEFGGSTAFDSG